MSAHTPGEKASMALYLALDNIFGISNYYPPDGMSLEEVYTEWGKIIDRETAAPELLAVCKLAQAYILRVSKLSIGKGDNDYANYDLLETVESAIRKAKGA